MTSPNKKAFLLYCVYSSISFYGFIYVILYFFWMLLEKMFTCCPLKYSLTGAPVWLRRLSVWVLIWTQVMISGHEIEPPLGLYAGRGACLLFSLSLSLCMPPPFMHGYTHAFSKNKIKYNIPSLLLKWEISQHSPRSMILSENVQVGFCEVERKPGSPWIWKSVEANVLQGWSVLYPWEQS